jgi:DNA replication protein DnaC
MSDDRSQISESLAEGLERLGLNAMLDQAGEMFLRARLERWTPEQLLLQLVEAELSHRHSIDEQQRLETAAFPVERSLDTFDLTHTSLTPQRFEYLTSLQWINKAENLILVGPAGTGKSHLAIALGHQAIAAGFRVRFLTTVELVERLYEALAANTVASVISELLTADLVILDEMGFNPLDDTGCQLLFRFVSAAYEHRSLAVTSHWPFESWHRFLPEPTTAVSLLDRLVHHSVIVVTNGDSFRLREARERHRRASDAEEH